MSDCGGPFYLGRGGDPENLIHPPTMHTQEADVVREAMRRAAQDATEALAEDGAKFLADPIGYAADGRDRRYAEAWSAEEELSDDAERVLVLWQFVAELGRSIDDYRQDAGLTQGSRLEREDRRLALLASLNGCLGPSGRHVPVWEPNPQHRGHGNVFCSQCIEDLLDDVAESEWWSIEDALRAASDGT